MKVEYKPINSLAELPDEEYWAPGHRACAGCAAATIMRLVAKAAGKDVIIAHATGCMEVVSTIYPYTAWRVPWIHIAFENAAAVASGIEAAIKALKRKGFIPKDRKIKVIAIGGDGGTFDIGLQALSGMLERGHDVLYVLYDNEAYMNTGIQRSGATPLGAATTTSPAGKKIPGKPQRKKDILGIVMAHKINYVASANPAYPLDLVNKVRKALAIGGPAFIYVLSPCVPGWRYPPHLTMKIAKLAVETCFQVLFEYTKDEGLKITHKIKKAKPLEEYLKLQGRFAHLFKPENKHILDELKRQVMEDCIHIYKLAGEEPPSFEGWF